MSKKKPVFVYFSDSDNMWRVHMNGVTIKGRTGYATKAEAVENAQRSANQHSDFDRVVSDGGFFRLRYGAPGLIFETAGEAMDQPAWYDQENSCDWYPIDGWDAYMESRGEQW